MLIDTNVVDDSWKPLLHSAWQQVDSNYKEALAEKTDWLPGPEQLFNAFSLPLTNLNYILFGESPYPRPISANGYAFWDGRVQALWSPTGLSKTVNHATSLRNIMKMLLVAEGLLSVNNVTQPAIAALDKHSLIQTGPELFTNFLNKGFLLLNTTPVLSKKPVKTEAKYWHPFIVQLLTDLTSVVPDLKLILLGKVAETINGISASKNFTKLCAEHPYNLSFIANETIINFFRPLHLLRSYR